MLTEAAARWRISFVFFFWGLDLSEVCTDNRLNTDCWFGEDVVGIDPKQHWIEWIITSWYPACLHWDDEIWTRSLEQSFRLLLKYSLKSAFIGPNRSNAETQGSWMLAFLGWKASGLALEASFLAVGEVKIASPKELASRSEAIALVMPVEANLALHGSALSLSKVGVASLLAPNGVSLLTSRLGTLALCTGSGSEMILASLSAHRGALALASWDRRGWALRRAKLASHEAESRDFSPASQEVELDFSIQIALEVVLGL